MALGIKLDADIDSIIRDLEKVRAKAVDAYKDVEREGKKANKMFEMQTKNLMMAGAGAAAAFWGIAQVSPLVSAMLSNIGKGFGAIFNVIFSSLLPVFTPLLEKLFEFASWLQVQPNELKVLLAALILVPPVLIAMAAGYKAALIIQTAYTAATVQTTIAVRALTLAMAANPIALAAIAIIGIGSGMIAWAMGAEKTIGPMSRTNEETEIMLTHLDVLKRELAAQQALLGEWGPALVLIGQDMTGAVGVFLSEVQAMVAATPDLPAAALLEIDGLVSDIEGNADDIEAILAGAYGRELTPDEIAAIGGFADENEKMMKDVNTLLTGAGADGLPQTLIDASSKVTTFGNSWDTVSEQIVGTDGTGGIVGDIDTLNTKIDSIEDIMIRAELDAESVRVGFDNMTAWWNQFMGQEGGWFGSLGKNPFAMPDLGQGNDFIWRSGQGVLKVNPMDDIYATKQGGEGGFPGGGGGGGNINIDVHDNILTGRNDIDYLVDEISAKLRQETGRYI